MRTPLLLILPIALVAAQVLASPAAPGTQPVQPKLPSRPDPKLETPAKITGVKRTPPRGPASLGSVPYTEGPISFDVEVTNGGGAFSTTLIVERLDGTSSVAVAKVPVSLAGGERALVAAVDEAGLKKSCEPTEYRLKLESGGSSRRLTVNPTCSFGTEVLDPVASSPDGVKQRQNKVHYHSPSFTPATLTCGFPLEVKATVKNDTSTPATGARLVFEGPRESGASLPFDLAPGKEAKPSAQLRFLGFTGDYVLRLDANSVATFPTAPSAWRVNVMRSCELALVLD